MKPVYVLPASYSPPTYGHLHVAKKAAELFPEVILICSVNPEKNSWFTPEEAKHLWASYDLPANIRVETLESVKALITDNSQIVMVRGIRNEEDLDYEKKVALFNKEILGIDKFVYIFCDDGFKDTSSSVARRLAQNLDLEDLSKHVSPLVVSALLEKVLGINHLFMVVGRPGSGKSTFLKVLAARDPRNVHINTDEFNKALRPLLKEAFGNEDLIQVALTREEELQRVMAKPWLEMLKNALRSVPKGSNVFVEIPFGLQESKKMFRFVGGKVIYVGCGEGMPNEERIAKRNTPELKPFIERIPDEKQTREIVEKNRLNLIAIKTEGTLETTEQKADQFNSWLGKEEKWKTFLPGLSLAI